jgi:hypothetical protein
MSEQHKGSTNAQLASRGLKECPMCNYCWNRNGFSRHYKACKSHSDSRQHALQATKGKEKHLESLSNLSTAQLQEQHSTGKTETAILHQLVLFRLLASLAIPPLFST